MKVKLIKGGVFHGGEELAINAEMDLDAASGSALIASGHAEEVNDVVKDDLSDLGGEGKQTPDGGAEGGKMEPGQSAGGTNDAAELAAKEAAELAAKEAAELAAKEAASGTNADAELAKAKKALEHQYTREELYAAAIKAGVEIAYNATKAVIIEAVIVQGKVEALLK